MKNICIVTPRKHAYSETFIQAQIQRLPYHIHVLPQRWMPLYPNQAHQHPPGIRRSVMALCQAAGLPPETIHYQLALRYLQLHKIDLVLAEYGVLGASMQGVCREAGIPFVVHFHGYDAYRSDVLETFGGAYQRMFAAAHGIIAVSRDMEAQLLSLGAPRDRLHYNPYGVDPSLFMKTNPAHNPPTFVAVGRFVHKKAPHKTLYAFRAVLDTCPDARLVMIGDGYLWEPCKQLAQVLGIAYRVTFPGPLPHAAVAATMQRARVFVQHSIRAPNGDSEGTPVSILEAGMAGLPVVSTRHAGIIDVVQHETTGFLVDEGDIDSMAGFMIQLATDASLAAELGSKARHHIETHFAMNQSITHLAHILEQALR